MLFRSKRPKPNCRQRGRRELSCRLRSWMSFQVCVTCSIASLIGRQGSPLPLASRSQLHRLKPHAAKSTTCILAAASLAHPCSRIAAALPPHASSRIAVAPSQSHRRRITAARKQLHCRTSNSIATASPPHVSSRAATARLYSHRHHIAAARQQPASLACDSNPSRIAASSPPHASAASPPHASNRVTAAR